MVPLEIKEPLEGVGSFSAKWDGTQVVRVHGKRLYLLSYHADVEIFMGPGVIQRFTSLTIGNNF